MDVLQAKRALLTGLPIFGALPPDIIDRLASYSRTTRYARDEAIFRKGDEGTGLLVVMSGAVKVVLPSSDGQEIVLNIIGASEVVGEIALLDGQARTADCVAIQPTELLALDRRDFLPLLQSRPELALAMIDVLCQRLRKASTHIENLVFSNPEVRLARVLLDLSGRLAEGRSRRVVMTQQQLGTMIGLSRESTNKILRRWEKQGVLTLAKGELTIERKDALRAVVAADL
jgi:CRP/FNR family transcriptional regulator, cyclic AMP receptor protein